MRVIEIVPYQHRWTTEFQQIEAALRQALGPLALRIDHIGSTSVPGLCAKDIVDIQVTVIALFSEKPMIAAFLAGGYQVRRDLQEDQRPAGDEQPGIEWQKRYCREPGEPDAFTSTCV